MKQEHILTVLYDLSLTLTGKTEVDALVNEFLARLVYHTGFACAVLLCQPEQDSSEDWPVCGAFANRDLLRQAQQHSHWNSSELSGPAALLPASTLGNRFAGGESYPVVLRLPVEDVGTILLFGRQLPAGEVPLENIFLPVLAGFSHAYKAYRANQTMLQELKLAKETAESASRAKSDFLSSMSHELRTPMNAIMGYAQLLQMDLHDEKREFADEISGAAEHLLQLIDDLLDLAKIEAGAIHIQLAPTTVQQQFDACLTLLKPVADHYGIHIETPPHCLATVQADPLRLKQVLLNLISNAIKYNRPGGKVTLGCEILADGEKVRIRVDDNGPGIPLEKQTQLFSTFNRLGKEMSDIQGTGIGLAISQRLTHMMYGEIGFSSQPEQGARFWVDLPASPMTAPPPPKSATPPSAPTAEARAHILYIEDHPANLSLMHSLLRPRTGLQVIDAPTGHLGLEYAGSNPPDLILLDLHLPDIDGFAVLQKLRSNPITTGIPVIAVTADSHEHTREKAFASGFDGYVSKPIRISELLLQIDRLLKQHTSTG